MKEYEFDAVILKHDSMDAAFIEFPYNVEKEFGTKGQVKVKATFDDYEYRGSLAKMGHHCHCLGLTKAVRKVIGKQPGDKVHVTLKRDVEVRKVDVPEDLAILLSQQIKAKEFFETLSYSNKKKYIQWITSAKKEETRKRRIEKAINLFSIGVKQP